MKSNVFENVDLSVAPMARADVEERLDSLHRIDEQIISLLDLASTAIATLRAGKISKEPSAQREFNQATAAYYTELERTSVALRREIRLLNDVSGDKVMPVNVVPKATAVGRQKEEAIWLSISEEKKEGGDGDDGSKQGGEKTDGDVEMTDAPKEATNTSPADRDPSEAGLEDFVEAAAAAAAAAAGTATEVVSDERQLGKLRLITK